MEVNIVPSSPPATNKPPPYAIVFKFFELPDVTDIQFIPSRELIIVPSPPTVTKIGDDVTSSSFGQSVHL